MRKSNSASDKAPRAAEARDGDASADQVNKQTLGDQVTRMLREGILFGEFEPGERLSEPELAKRFGVSLTPVREALGALAATGLVVRGGRRGTHVRRLTVRDVDNLLSAREALEVLAVRQAVPHVTKADVQSFEQILDAQEQATVQARDEPANALPRLASLNEAFHRLILGRTENEWLASLLGSIDDLVVFARMRLRMQATLERRRESLDEHRRIVRAIADGDVEAAAARMSEHVDRLKAHVLSLAAPSDADEPDPPFDGAEDERPATPQREDGADDLTRTS